LAYAGLADCSEFRRGSPDRLSAKSYLAKALSLDSTLSEALATTGLLQSQDNDWPRAKRTLQKAIALNPNYPLAHLYYGNLLLYTGENTQQGIEETKKALELDPLSRWMNWVLGRNYYLARQYDLAHEQLVKTLSIDSTFYPAKSTMGQVLLKQKKYAEAIQFISHFRPGHGIELCYAYAVSGDKLRARIELKKTVAKNPISDRQYSPIDSLGHLQLARTYAALGDYNEALMQLERANERREIAMYWVYVDPALDPLRNEPRFKALMKKMNFKL
jgi:serine/threonine-protein kinase